MSPESKKALKLRERAKRLIEQARQFEELAATVESQEADFVVGMTVEGWLHVGVKEPRWVRGIIVRIWGSSEGPCVTLESTRSSKRTPFYLKSLRHIGEDKQVA